MKQLPVFISIPHGGTQIPVELQGRLQLSDLDLFQDIDPFTKEIYNIGRSAKMVLFAEIARTCVDLNRAPDDLPPRNPDGVVKSHTCFRKEIYHQGQAPDATLRKQLLDRYYFPYHRRIKKELQRQDLAMGFDCHSMAPTGPDFSPDRGAVRPIICLGNNNGKSAPQEFIEKMAACFREAFHLRDSEVTINEPFSGGYITKTYGRRPLPWIQVELNRKLYLSSPWFDPAKRVVDRRRLKELNRMFEKALLLFFREQNPAYSEKE